MSIKSYKKSLALAVVMFVAALVALSSATYAWYSANSKANAEGMDVKTTAPTNMLISTDPTDPNGWDSIVDVSFNGTFAPASTADGKNFSAMIINQFVSPTGGIVAAGDEDNYYFKSVGPIEDEAYYFAEIPMYVKASKTDRTENLQMYLGDFEVTTSSNSAITDCVRISVTTVTTSGATGLTGKIPTESAFNASTGAVKAEYGTESDAIIYKTDSTHAVVPVESVTAGKATLASSDAAKTSDDPSTICFTVDPNGEDPKYTTIIVRLWFEGQHPECLNNLSGEDVSVTLQFRAANE